VKIPAVLPLPMPGQTCTWAVRAPYAFRDERPHRAVCEYASAFDPVILRRVAPLNRFVMPDDLSNNEGEELLGKIRVELAGGCELSQTAYLLGFSSGVARRQPVLGLQFADSAGCNGTVLPTCG